MTQLCLSISHAWRAPSLPLPGTDLPLWAIPICSWVETHSPPRALPLQSQKRCVWSRGPGKLFLPTLSPGSRLGKVALCAPDLPGWDEQPLACRHSCRAALFPHTWAVHSSTDHSRLNPLFKASAPQPAVSHGTRRAAAAPLTPASSALQEGPLHPPWLPWGRSSSGGSALFSLFTGAGNRGEVLRGC